MVARTISGAVMKYARKNDTSLILRVLFYEQCARLARQVE